MTTRRGGRAEPCATPSSAPMPSLLHLLLGQDLDLDAELLQFLRLGGEFDRPEHVGRLVDQVARQHHAVGDRLGVGEGLFGGGRIGAVDGDLRRLAVVRLAVVVVLLGLVLVEAVGAQQDAGGEVGRLGRADLDARQIENHGDLGRLAELRGHRAAELQPGIFVEVAALPAPIATSRSSRAPSGAITSTDAPNLPVNSAIAKARSQRPRRIAGLAGLAQAAASAERTRTLPFFGRGEFGKADRRSRSSWKVPAVLRVGVAGATFGGFAAFGKTSTPATGKHCTVSARNLRDRPVASRAYDDRFILSVNSFVVQFLSQSLPTLSRASTPMPAQELEQAGCAARTRADNL